MQSVIESIVGLGYWTWVIAAFVLMILETIVPGVHFLWFGVAAFFVALLTAAFDFSWQWQIISFGILAVAAFFLVRRFATPDNAKSDLPNLNIRGQQYVGRTVIVEQAILGGRGKVRVGDTIWTAQGPDLPSGSTVKVTGTNGTVLVVEAV